MIDTIEQLKCRMIPVLEEAGVLRAALFGSFARNEADENSDIDILVEFPKGKSLFDLIDLKDQLEEVTGRNVDVLTYKAVHPFLEKIIEREQVFIL